MANGTDSPALRALLAELERRSRQDESDADELADHAADHDRWGLSREADDLRRRARRQRVSALLAQATATSWRTQLAKPDRPQP